GGFLLKIHSYGAGGLETQEVPVQQIAAGSWYAHGAFEGGIQSAELGLLREGRFVPVAASKPQEPPPPAPEAPEGSAPGAEAPSDAIRLPPLRTFLPSSRLVPTRKP